MSDDTARPTRQERFLAKVGPHKQVGEVRVVNVPAKGGVMAYQDHRVTTACGREVPTTLTTREDNLVRCPNCLNAG